MNTLLVTKCNVATPVGRTAVKGAAMGQLRVIPDAYIYITDGVITGVGKRSDCPEELMHGASRVYDAGGCCVLPGFVDSHTHPVFGGYRPDEFSMRLKGATYMEIMRAGGGIQSTVNATRTASADELVEKTEWLMRRMARMGVTTVEAKSGYGLDTASERKMLEVIARMQTDMAGCLRIVPTWLGAHAVPAEYKGRTAQYVDKLISEDLDAMSGLAEYCDVFCEKDVFELEDSRRLLEAARAKGYRLKLHADEIVQLGGAELAAALGATSADHLLHVSDKGIADMACAGVVATLLPLTAFALKEPFAPARRFIEAGAAVALATDLNPGSCFSGSIPLTIALACIYMNMTVEETVTALTLNGAAALDRADMIGSIEPGKRADLAVLAFPQYTALPYYVGMNCVKATVFSGNITEYND